MSPYDERLVERRDRRIYAAMIDRNAPPSTLSAFEDGSLRRVWCRVRGADGQFVDCELGDLEAACETVRAMIAGGRPSPS